LADRQVEQPIKTMSDMASTNRNPNAPGIIVIQGGCWQHVRSHFLDIRESFPEQCDIVIDKVKWIFINEATTKASGLSDEDRLAYHQAESQPIVDDLYAWCEAQKENRLYEPNSPLGKAMSYVMNHKKMLTEFLRTPGVPIDNNDTEYAGKRPKRHQHNSLSYLTTTGSTVGDIVMTLTSAVKKVDDNPFEYLTFLMRHRDKVRAHPEKFVAWRWRETEAEMKSMTNAEAPPDWRTIVAVHQHQGRPVEATRDVSM
jgi:transposase